MAESTIVKASSNNLANANTDLGDLALNDEVKAKLVLYTGDISEHEEKKKKALKGVKKLLNMSEQYSAYFSKNLSNVFEQSEQERVDNLMKHKKSRNNDDLKDIPFFKGTLKDFQVIGVNWLINLFKHAVNGILADEMGLGKTVQVIALICCLIQKLKGPFLIVVPLSTLPNWKSEFTRFAPEIPVVVYHGNKNERLELTHKILKYHKLKGETCRPVVLTTIHMITREMYVFKNITWKYLIVDEGHCLKNPETQVTQNLSSLKSLNRLLLTGTPLQNNLKELWSLMNFVMPDIFKNIDIFSSLYLLKDFDDNSKIVKEEESTNTISSLHKILQPFMLRRTKSEVLIDLVPKKEVIIYCPLSALQRKLYMDTIEKNIIGFSQDVDEDQPSGNRPKRRCISRFRTYVEPTMDDEFVETDDYLPGESIVKTVDPVKYVSNITMARPLSMFQKIVNHPYLVNMPVTPERTLLVDNRLITESGKMMVLDILLEKLKSSHKVLIFSTFVMMLDIIEELMIIRNYTYCRIDGSTHLRDRADAVSKFNGDPNIFACLISTRAGGLGLNLIGADTAIIYDRDWNPQVDLQAQDRCHRIGQTKPVVVYSLITKNTVDQKILHCGNMKRKLEKVVVQKGKFTNPTSNSTQFLDLKELQDMLDKDDSSVIVHENIFSEEEWAKLLDRSDMYGKTRERLNS